MRTTAWTTDERLREERINDERLREERTTDERLREEQINEPGRFMSGPGSL